MKTLADTHAAFVSVAAVRVSLDISPTPGDPNLTLGAPMFSKRARAWVRPAHGMAVEWIKADCRCVRANVAFGSRLCENVG